MTTEYKFAYLPCQFCVGKNHCAQCGEEIRQALLKLEGVAGIEMDVPARTLRLILDGADFEDVEEQAEIIGVFL